MPVNPKVLKGGLGVWRISKVTNPYGLAAEYGWNVGWAARNTKPALAAREWVVDKAAQVTGLDAKQAEILNGGGEITYGKIYTSGKPPKYVTLPRGWNRKVYTGNKGSE